MTTANDDPMNIVEMTTSRTAILHLNRSRSKGINRDI